MPIKRDVFKKVINKNSKTVYEILAYTTSDTTYEAKVCQAFLTELKELNRLKRFCTFHQRLNSVFHDQLDDENFLAWLVEKLNLRKGRFKDSVHAWRRKQGEDMASPWKTNRLFIMHGLIIV